MTKQEKLLAELARLEQMNNYQKQLSGSTRFVFGIDEAGRGPLCGPVVAACCMLPSDCSIMYLNDSKKLSEKKREQLYDEIVSKAMAYGIGQADAGRIDRINILNATYEAMQEAFEHCLRMYSERIAADNEGSSDKTSMDQIDMIPQASDSLVLVDGNRIVPGIRFDQLPVIGGDAKCPSISAASILAKVTRDRIMLSADSKYPEYGFAKNKGYGTKQHYQAIKEHGILDIHRKTFLKHFQY